MTNGQRDVISDRRAYPVPARPAGARMLPLSRAMDQPVEVAVPTAKRRIPVSVAGLVYVIAWRRG